MTWKRCAALCVISLFIGQTIGYRKGERDGMQALYDRTLEKISEREQLRFVEILPVCLTDELITGVTVTPIPPVDVQIDLAFGPVGGEVVALSARRAKDAKGTIRFAVPLPCDGERLSGRVRASGSYALAVTRQRR